MAFRRTARGRAQGTWGLALFAVASATLAACGLDWDLLDPSLGPPGEASSSSVNAASGAGGAGSGGGGASSTTVASTSSSGVGGGAQVSSSSGGGGSPMPSTVTYDADVAECIVPTDPDPDDCEFDTGKGLMSIDELVSATGERNEAFLRFDLDGTFAGKTVIKATLRLVVADHASSGSVQTGEVWQVTPFKKVDLYNDAPNKIGNSPLAADMGNVAIGDKVNFDLPASLIKPNSSVYLGIYPLSSDGVEYWNTSGDIPPSLIVEYL